MEGLCSGSFENPYPGRRIVFNFPVGENETVRVAVLDSAMAFDEVTCAAMLVPKGEEEDWIYSSEGGQWQLLAAAGVSRIVIVERNFPAPETEGFGNQGIGYGSWGRQSLGGRRRLKRFKRAGSQSSCSQCEDEALKTRLQSLVVALAPRICFRGRIPNVPFVVYTSNVIHRVVVEEVYSSLTGAIVVEDVALDNSDTETLESESFVRQSEGESECSHRVGGRGGRGLGLERVMYRRRLRFKRMPNLIQTEVSLVLSRTLSSSGMRISGDVDLNTVIDKESVGAFFEKGMSRFQIDHSRLVHKYLPPIVAGLVLAASCIEPCMERGTRPKVVTLGVGGGALPMFLHQHVGFHVQAVDMDRAVLDLAYRHFGLKNSDNMEVQAGDALQFVDNLAVKVTAEDAVPEGEEALAQPSHTQIAGVSNVSSVHHRVHVIIVDIDEGDARCGLGSPPSSFLEPKFLTAARTVLHEEGLLAMNVVPNGANSFSGVVSSLLSVFHDVYETAVQGDVNRVFFALPSEGAGISLDGPLACLVKRFLDVGLITAIKKTGIEG